METAPPWLLLLQHICRTTQTVPDEPGFQERSLSIMNPFCFFRDQESFMQWVTVILYNQRGHSSRPNARQCHFGMRSIRDGHLQKKLLLLCKLLWQAKGSSSTWQADASLSIDAPTAASIYPLLRPPLRDHKWQNTLFQFQWLHTHLWSAGNIILVNKKVAGNPALYFLLLKVMQELKSRCKQTCW